MASENEITNVAPEIELAHALIEALGGSEREEDTETTEDTSSNVTVLDFEGLATGTSVTPGRSKFCQAFIWWVAENLLELMSWFESCPEATFAVITPYLAEQNKILRIMTSMMIKGVPLEQLNRISVVTIDECSGREWDVVIFLVTVGDDVGRVGDPRQLSMAMSRAKNGLILLLNSAQIAISEGDKSSLDKLLDMTQEQRILIQLDTLPHSEYYTPQRA